MRHNFSNKEAYIFRKYVVGILLLLIALFLFYKFTFLRVFFGIITLGFSVFFLRFKFIQFDEENVYIGSKVFKFNEIQKISGIEINQFFFPALVIIEKGKKKYYFTDVGKAGLVQIVLGIIFPSLDPLKNIKLFTEYFNQSKNIK
ncbi:MAG: hypothetical protein ACK476_08765 [Fluviicola sp.]|jgi:hypothetical protein